MEFSLDLNQTRSLGNLKKFDIIKFESQYVDLDIFMVHAVEKDEKIPAILLQLWQFNGGYNHSFKNVMENDLGINQQVPYFSPEKKHEEIIEILSYRSNESRFSKKEELFFDVWPDETSNQLTEKFNIPFEVKVKDKQDEKVLILPDWTPLQRLPLDRIKIGTQVETWKVDSITNIMRVIRL